MARYIDKQELIKFLDERGYFKHAIYRSVIEDFPTANVVPKSEVEKIFEDIERTFNAVLVGDISDILKVLTELKKKYTEGER